MFHSVEKKQLLRTDVLKCVVPITLASVDASGAHLILDMSPYGHLPTCFPRQAPHSRSRLTGPGALSAKTIVAHGYPLGRLASDWSYWPRQEEKPPLPPRNSCSFWLPPSLKRLVLSSRRLRDTLQCALDKQPVGDATIVPFISLPADPISPLRHHVRHPPQERREYMSGREGERLVVAHKRASRVPTSLLAILPAKSVALEDSLDAQPHLPAGDYVQLPQTLPTGFELDFP
ncbi:hypothetical protein C8F01DRAFT_1345818 [Mycena amicta]|nr:hypothetical protein C8F01DRAFT_1311349 [Mycena amicta]KAJ7066004.1 hypothetical protein C8F01DRAFT_1345818 [Mycena amicta]